MEINERIRGFFIESPLMTLTVNQKLAALFIIILSYNIWLNLLSYLVYSAFEMTEYYLEVLVRNLFGVRHHISELIVFYLFFFLAFCGFARLWFLLPRIYRYFCVLGKHYKQEFLKSWRPLALLEKIKLSVTYFMMSSGCLFFLFL
ncbi:MAG: hypothetical protein GQ569_08130 [Methylococcaceae bacterium]|nr:hypothetical protein [Methylococcaceae bacterium]